MNNSRILLVSIFILIFFIMLTYNLFNIQVLKHDDFTYRAQQQQMSTEKIMPERGLIYDRNNILLVYNKNNYSFQVDILTAEKNSKYKPKEAIAEKFSEVFGKPRSHYLNLMQTNKRHIFIEEKVPSEKALLLKNFRASGLKMIEDPTRVYPYGSMASHLLGYVNTEYEGTNGIERLYDDLLKGEEGVRIVEKNALGETILVSEEDTRPAVPGSNLVLTLSKSYQAILEEELDNGLKKFGGTSATGIIMDPNTGEVLALANKSDFDPNYYYKYSDDNRRNRSVTDTYEPGSTFKSFTLAVMLDQNLCRPEEVINVENGVYRFKGVNIRDTHSRDKLSVRGVIEESSNIGMTKLVQRVDNDIFFKYLRGFGFGTHTAAKLPGEAKGTLRKPNTWSALTKTFLSFGYEISVTPLQMAAAYCALVNGGILYEPVIVKKQVSKNGVVVKETEPAQVRRVISEETSALIRNLLTGVVENGTGANARIKNIKIGGKTGTSQKLVEGSYSKSEYNSSFIGFFPADDPQVVMLILVNSPENGKYGGAVAAPIFKEVASRIIDADLNKFYREDKSIEMLNASKLNGGGKIVVKEVSSAGREIDFSTIKKNIMPDLTGSSLRDAILALSKIGLKHEVKGSGIITAQSIAPGTPIKKGMKCVLSCGDFSISGTKVY